jgi:hypothetical protein
MINVPLGSWRNSSKQSSKFGQTAPQADSPRTLAGAQQVSKRCPLKSEIISCLEGWLPPGENALAPVGTYPNPWNGITYDEIFEFDFGPDGTPTVKEVTEDFKVPGSTGH